MTKQLTINGTSWMEFRDTMAALEPFKTYGNLVGVAEAVYGLGRLPEPHASEYFEARKAGRIDYTVMSYGTPIAWHDTERGWVMPDVKYSVTTSKAQGRIAAGIAALNTHERVEDALTKAFGAPGTVTKIELD